MLVNFIVARVLRIFSSFEKHSTYSTYNLSVLNKLVIFMFCNSVLIHIAVYNNHFDDWFCEGGLTYAIFWVQVMNAGIGPVVYFLSPPNFFKMLKRRSIIKSDQKGDLQLSQLDANMAFEATEPDLADRFANMTKTLFLSLFYAPIVPIGVAIGIVGITFDALIFRYMLLRIHSRPKRHNVELVIEAAEWIPYVILSYGTGILVFYRDLTPSLVSLITIFFLLTVLYVFTPLVRIFSCCIKEGILDIMNVLFEGDNTFNDYFTQLPHFYSDYARENPVTRETGIERWNLYMQTRNPESYYSLKKEDKITLGLISKEIFRLFS